MSERRAPEDKLAPQPLEARGLDQEHGGSPNLTSVQATVPTLAQRAPSQDQKLAPESVKRQGLTGADALHRHPEPPPRGTTGHSSDKVTGGAWRAKTKDFPKPEGPGALSPLVCLPWAEKRSLRTKEAWRRPRGSRQHPTLKRQAAAGTSSGGCNIVGRQLQDNGGPDGADQENGQEEPRRRTLGRIPRSVPPCLLQYIRRCMGSCKRERIHQYLEHCPSFRPKTEIPSTG